MRSKAKFGRFGVRSEIAMALLDQQQRAQAPDTASTVERPLTDREAEQALQHAVDQTKRRLEADALKVQTDLRAGDSTVAILDREGRR